MKLYNQKFINLLSIAFIISLSFVACKNANDKIEDTAEKVEIEAKELKNASEKLASEVMTTIKENTLDAGVLNLTQVDTPPLMDKSCKEVKNPKDCSDRKVLKFIKNNIVKPTNWKNEGSLEQVLVVIEKDGSLRDIKYVASSNNKGCKECQKSAVDVVGKMDNWVPATKDGKPVAVRLTIPVKFI